MKTHKCNRPSIKKGDTIEYHHPFLGIFKTEILGETPDFLIPWMECRWFDFKLPTKELYHTSCCSSRIISINGIRTTC